jgi:hypothetical protein
MSETIGRLLAAGNVAEVFEWGSRVVKLYRFSASKPTAFREAAIHAAAEAMALPVPAVWGVLEIGGRWGIVFDRVKERSFAERMREDPSLIPECLLALARLHASIHSQPAREFRSLKSRLATNIAGTGRLDEPLKQILLGRLAGMPDGDFLGKSMILPSVSVFVHAHNADSAPRRFDLATCWPKLGPGGDDG